VLLEMSENDSFYSIVLLDGKKLAIIKLSINPLSVCQSFELFPVFKKIA
jgi:hypothetical protein